MDTNITNYYRYTQEAINKYGCVNFTFINNYKTNGTIEIYTNVDSIKKDQLVKIDQLMEILNNYFLRNNYKVVRLNKYKFSISRENLKSPNRVIKNVENKILKNINNKIDFYILHNFYEL